MLQTESWVPICLPGISAEGFLQLYCNFLDSKIGVVFITQSQEHSRFLEFFEQSKNVFLAMENEKIEQNLYNLINYNYKFKHRNNTQIIVEYSPDKLVEEFMKTLANNNTKQTDPLDIMENVKFLVCKNKNNNQYFTFKINNYENITEEERSVFTCYSKLYDKLKVSSNSNTCNINSFFHYEKDELYTHAIQTNDNYILFVTFSLFSEFEDVNGMIVELLKSIKLRDTYYFIKKIPT